MIETGPQNLRHAAKTVRVLHTLAVQVRTPDLALLEKAGKRSRHIRLAGLAAQSLDARIERGVARFCRIDRKGAYDDGRREQRLGAKQAAQGKRGRNLGPVDERQSLLC